MPSAAKIIKMRAEPSGCPEPAEGLLERRVGKGNFTLSLSQNRIPME